MVHEVRKEPVETEASEDKALGMSETVRVGLLELAKKVLDGEKSPRRAEVREAWKQRAFDADQQYLWWDARNYTMCSAEASGAELPMFMKVYNIFKPHKRSFVSILSANPPGVNFVPDDLQQSNDVTAAAYAEKMRHRVDRLVSTKDIQQQIAALFCTDGRTITWTRTVNDVLRVSVHGVLESRMVPFCANSLAELSAAALSREGDIHEMKAQWEDFADDIENEIGSGGADTNYERLARLNIIANNRGSGYADSLKGVATEHTVWLRPSRYPKKENHKEVAEFLEKFEDGVRLTVCGGALVECIGEKIEDALVVEWPSPGQGMNRSSMLRSLVPIQEDFNDFSNHLREQAEYVDPMTYIAQDAYDDEAMAESRNVPAGMTVLKLPSGKSISDVIATPPVSVMSAELSTALQNLQALAEFTTGDLPSLSGEGDPHSETASGQKMLSDQAKGQLSNAWGAMQRLMAGTYSLAVPLAAKLDQDKPTVAIKGGNGQDSFSPSAILNGHFGCYPDTDSSFPESQADKRASLQMVLSQLGPADPKLILHPDNQKLIKQYSGLSDLVIPAANSRDKQLEEIEQMLKEPPVPDVNSPQYAQYQEALQQWRMQEATARTAHFAAHVASGGDANAYQSPQQPLVQQPQPPLTSSVQIDVVYDQHADEYAKLVEWVNTESCREEIRKGNQQGVQNVKLHGNLHKAQIDAAAQANAPKVEPPKVSLTMAVTDPTTIAQFAQAAGATEATPQGIAQSQVADNQETAAKTAHIGAQAQHASVLAAKEAVEPAHKLAIVQPPLASDNQAPDQSGGGVQ